MFLRQYYGCGTAGRNVNREQPSFTGDDLVGDSFPTSVRFDGGAPERYAVLGVERGSLQSQDVTSREVPCSVQLDRRLSCQFPVDDGDGNGTITRQCCIAADLGVSPVHHLSGDRTSSPACMEQEQPIVHGPGPALIVSPRVYGGVWLP